MAASLPPQEETPTVTAAEGVTVDPTRAAWRQMGGAPSPIPAVVSVACTTGGCVRNGAQQEVRLDMAAMGVVAMPTYMCAHCGAVLLISWPRKENSDVP